MINRTAFIVFMLLCVTALEADDGDHVPVTFEGIGRLYSLEDEMAKPMCHDDTMHLGEYLIHYNRLGNKSLDERYYPFLIYVPAIGETPFGGNPAPSRIVFSSCLEASEQCASPTIKSGSRWSHMMSVFSGGIGEHMLLVGAARCHSAVEGDPLKDYKDLVAKANANFIDQPLDKKKVQSVKVNMTKVELFLRQNMPPNYAIQKFQVVNPRDCVL